MECLRQLKKCLFPAIVLMSIWAPAQNFVPNPSFETHSGCPTSPGVFSIVGNWYVVPSHGGSPDYHHVCGSSTFGVPVNVFGSQLARTGQGYIGFVTDGLSAGFREYLEVQLTSPLTAGLSYTASAYLSLSDGSGWATDGFGFYFSSSSVSGTGTTNPLPFTPQVSNPSGNYMNSWTNWLPVSGNFVATPGLQFMTIGNFKSDAATGVQVMPSGWFWNYTYADDFSVIPAVILSADVSSLQGEVLAGIGQLQWQTRSERGTQYFEIERSLGDMQHFVKVGTLPATGDADRAAAYTFDDQGFEATQLNYYRVKEVDQNGEGGYTETILLETAALENLLQLSAFPNPVHAGNTVQGEVNTTKQQSADLTLMDVDGRILQQVSMNLQVGANPFHLSCDHLAGGVYVLKVNAGGKQALRKIMVQ